MEEVKRFKGQEGAKTGKSKRPGPSLHSWLCLMLKAVHLGRTTLLISLKYQSTYVKKLLVLLSLSSFSASQAFKSCLSLLLLLPASEDLIV